MGLDSVELVLAVEKHFGVQIADQELANIRTVGEYHAALLEKLGLAVSDPKAAEVWERLADVIVEESGVDRGRIVPGARIVRDLGIN